MKEKKSEKARIGSITIITFGLAGLAFMLLLSWRTLEYTTVEVEPPVEEAYVPEMIEEEEVPITQPLFDTPPPPPPPPPEPEVIEVVEDEVEIEEDIIETTEIEEEEEIVEIDEISEEEGVEEQIADVPFAIIEEAPIFPGCEDKKTKADRKKCLQESIRRHIDRRFDKGLANDLGLEGRQRISVRFAIDSKGNVVDIMSRAPHPRLKQETAEVIGELPKMTPGRQRGKAVKVIYTLPIIFDVRN